LNEEKKGNKTVVRQMGRFIWHSAFLFSSPALKNSRETVRTICSGKRCNAVGVMRSSTYQGHLKSVLLVPDRL